MKSLTLTIVIPVYNEESYLKSCLEAIANQSMQPDEVIVVNNNSSDNTAEIARKFSFVTLITETKQGLYHARQTGMDNAKSEVLARIDADTVVDKKWVENIKSAFSNPRVNGLTGPVGYYDMPFPGFTQKSEDFFLRLARAGQYDFMMGANMAVRKSAWKLIRTNLCNEPYLFEDIDIVMHLREQKIRPDYFPNVRANVSARRFEDNFADFMRYIGGHTRTHEHHNQKTPLGVHFAEGAFALAYIGFKPFHMMYDPKIKRPSLKYLMTRKQARPDPMTTK